MSRRQSRVPVDTRQTDTLLEFETFKKKFLLANKHITKLNSTLSVRIEELNAQISTLYVENLRLRASEIALASQLKKERDRSRKIMADAEAATQNLMRHLGHIRKSFNLPAQLSTSPEAPPPPRARRPVPDPNSSPTIPRLARPPAVPGIVEDDENNLSEEETASPTPHRRKSKPRSSLTRPMEIDFEDELSKTGKRKPTRRQSGLLTTEVAITTIIPAEDIPSPRPPSPAFGSAMRKEAAHEEEEEVLAVLSAAEPMDEDEDEEPVAMTVTRRDRKKKGRDRESDEPSSIAEGSRRDREKRRARDSDEGPNPLEAKKPKLKDVTNSPPPRPSLATLEIPSDRDRQRTPESDVPVSGSSTATTASFATARNFLTSAPTPAPPPRSAFERNPIPPPQRSSSPIPPIDPSDADQPTGGRERRVRKSVNYAEPKLNTKMRKPDPLPGTSKRSSIATESAPRKSVEAPSVLPSSNLSGPGDVLTSQPAPPPVAGVKRKKSRVHVPVDEEEESEGAQADAEYGAGIRPGGGSSGWVNEARRRNSQHYSNSSRRVDGDDPRRHSMAV